MMLQNCNIATSRIPKLDKILKNPHDAHWYFGVNEKFINKIAKFIRYSIKSIANTTLAFLLNRKNFAPGEEKPFTYLAQVVEHWMLFNPRICDKRNKMGFYVALYDVLCCTQQKCTQMELYMKFMVLHGTYK